MESRKKLEKPRVWGTLKKKTGSLNKNHLKSLNFEQKIPKTPGILNNSHKKIYRIRKFCHHQNFLMKKHI